MSRGNKRDVDRQRAANRAAKNGVKASDKDGLTAQQRRDRCVGWCVGMDVACVLAALAWPRTRLCFFFLPRAAEAETARVRGGRLIGRAARPVSSTCPPPLPADAGCMAWAMPWRAQMAVRGAGAVASAGRGKTAPRAPHPLFVPPRLLTTVSTIPSPLSLFHLQKNDRDAKALAEKAARKAAEAAAKEGK